LDNLEGFTERAGFANGANIAWLGAFSPYTETAKVTVDMTRSASPSTKDIRQDQLVVVRHSIRIKIRSMSPPQDVFAFCYSKKTGIASQK
jgi:hypothetical protein